MIGVTANDEAIEAFNQMKLRHHTAYLIFRVEGPFIVVDVAAEKENVGEEYLEQFMADIKSTGEPRYAVVDWQHKLLFVAWSPDNASGRHKMTYASARENFVQQLEGITLKLQATDDGELTVEEITRITASTV